MRMLFAAIVPAVMLASFPAWGQDEERKSYAGVSVGFSESGGVCQEDDMVGSSPSCTGTTLWRLFGGHHFNRHFALEGALHAVERTGGGALELAAVGVAPLDEHIALYGRLGAFTTDRASSERGLTLAAGVRFNVGESFGVRLEWQGYSGGDSFDLLSVGVFIRF